MCEQCFAIQHVCAHVVVVADVCACVCVCFWLCVFVSVCVSVCVDTFCVCEFTEVLWVLPCLMLCWCVFVFSKWA